MPATIPPGTRVLTVGEVTRVVKHLLEQTLTDIWVEGEVSNLARPASGHVYLTLKDEESPLRTVVYRGVALRLRFDLRDGQRVIIRGRLSVYAQRGEYNLLAEEVHPKGIGPLELAFRQLKEKLSLAGYFEPRRKKPLPAVPRRIGLLSSSTGSAVRDVLETLARRWPAAEVLVCPVRVQGDGAATEVAAGLDLLNRVTGTLPIDVILIARGGGSLEDLWAFNEEPVAHAIHRSAIPVITGIGHEDDLTIADLVADRRALTPTDSAQRAVPDRAEMLQAFETHRARLGSALARTVQIAKARLAQIDARLKRGADTRAEGGRSRLESAAGRLEALSPLAVLSRGYSITLTEGQVVRDAADVKPGDRIVTRLGRGVLSSVVEGGHG